MKFQKSDLDSLEVPYFRIDQEMAIEIEDHPRCREIRNVQVVGDVFYEKHDAELSVQLDIAGEMVVPCAITLKPLDIDFSVHYDEIFSFYAADDEEETMDEESLEEIIYLDAEELDLEPHLRSVVLAEIPLKVVDPELEDYPEGDGWVVMTEEAYEEEKSQEIDPRLAKLQEFKVD